MERKELAEMLEGVVTQGYGVDNETLQAILVSHLNLLDKFDRATTCR